MSNLIEQLKNLSTAYKNNDCKFIEDMTVAATKYLAEVVALDNHYANYDNKNQSSQLAIGDIIKSKCEIQLEAFIATVKMTNICCRSVGLPPIYTGDNTKKDYGEFAFNLVKEIYKNQNR